MTINQSRQAKCWEVGLSRTCHRFKAHGCSGVRDPQFTWKNILEENHSFFINLAWRNCWKKFKQFPLAVKDNRKMDDATFMEKQRQKGTWCSDRGSSFIRKFKYTIWQYNSLHQTIFVFDWHSQSPDLNHNEYM